MGYTPLKINNPAPSIQKETTLMAKGGQNDRDLPQLLNVDFAQVIKNYLIDADGQLIKRGGLDRLFNVAGEEAITMLEKYDTNLYIFGYKTTIAVYDISLDTITDIKTDFSTNSGFEGVTYGDYFFSCNEVDEIERIYRNITAASFYDTAGTNKFTYGGKTADFTTGQVLTGTLSGATATVNADTDSFPTTDGTLNVTAILGTFLDGEDITDPLGGDANITNINPLAVGSFITGATSGATGVILEATTPGEATQSYVIGVRAGTLQNGELITDTATLKGQATTTSAVTWESATITGSPTCGVLRVIGARLIAGRLQNEPTTIHYSQIDTGANPPFSTWTEDTLANGSGKIANRRGGQVNDIQPFGQNIVVFQEDGKYAFFINQIDSAGTLSRTDVFQMSRFDFGGARGAVSTASGLFYVNESGLWQLQQVGSLELPQTDQEGIVSVLLGDKFFDDFTLTNTDLAYDSRNKLILMTSARSSAINNVVLAYHVETKAFIEVTGWNINRWLVDGEKVYGGSSTNTRVFRCFSGSDDDGANIGTEYKQELRTGELDTRQMLYGGYIQGFLSPSTTISVRYDIYDVTGKLIKDKLKLQWTAQSNNNTFDGYNSAQYANSAYGGDFDTANLVESFDGFSEKIRNYQRIVLHITNNDKLPHIINWTSLLTRVKRRIRRRKMTNVT